jgi:nitroimidazol reductase NimA-like FMN-containing flavoprotein (pyridoxamine 5'-phosphate oxidase superfamily)
VAKLNLSLSLAELKAYLGTQRTIRLATSSREGTPHVVPLWFVWLDGVIFLNSTQGNVTIRNLEENPTATGAVDDGESYDELRGVLLHGTVQWADGDDRLDTVMQMWSEKYLAGNPVPYGKWKNRVWFRLVPTKLTSWDFRKIPEAKARERDGRS